MICRTCGTKLKVLDSHSNALSTGRKLKCPNCNELDYTVETRDVRRAKLILSERARTNASKRNGKVCGDCVDFKKVFCPMQSLSATHAICDSFEGR